MRVSIKTGLLLVTLCGITLGYWCVPRQIEFASSELYGESGSILESWLIQDEPDYFESLLGYPGSANTACLDGSDPRLDMQIQRLNDFFELRVVDAYGVHAIPTPPRLPRVKTLRLTRCGSGAIRDLIANCPRLEVLKITNCQNLTDADLKVLSSRTGLKELDINDSKLTGIFFSDVAQCQLLHDLTFLNSPLSQHGVLSLSDISSLRSLTLGLTKEVHSVAELQKLPELQAVKILGNFNKASQIEDQTAALKSLIEHRQE